MGWRSGWLFLGVMCACGPVVDGDATASQSDSGESSSTGDTPPSITMSGTSTPQPTTDEPPPPDLPLPSADLGGTYLLALSAVIDPGHPLQWLANVEHTSGPDGDQVTIELQSLSLDVGSTNAPRLPVGDPIVLQAGLREDGTFGIETPQIDVPGAANPITGSDLSASLVIQGTAYGRELWCGEVFGMVTVPLMLDLTGSTFAFTPAEPLPDPVLSTCPD